jgi:hypothetical protein
MERFECSFLVFVLEMCFRDVELQISDRGGTGQPFMLRVP